MTPNTLINGDALTVLRQMEAESVDFIITDPPYGVDFQSGRVEKARRKGAAQRQDRQRQKPFYLVVI